MSFPLARYAALALLPIAVAGCAGAPPAPVATGHPAHADTAVAAPAQLTTLQSYRDYGRPETGPAPAQAQPDAAREKHDAHEH